MRRSTAYLAATALLLLLSGLALLHAGALRRALRPERELRRELVATLRLTDLALFNEARYTRHLSQADLHTAFQEHPLSLEHFPSGSLAAPPARLRGAP